MRSIAVFFDDPAQNGYPFDNQEYRDSYRDFAKLLRERSGKLFVARGKSYRGGNTFASGWLYDEEGILVAHKEPFTTDVIYNKGHLTPEPGALVVNHPELDALCTDKRLTVELLAEISPRTYVVSSAREFDVAVEKLDAKKIVMKPIDGEGGAGVHIGAPASVRKCIEVLPCLVQECVDTNDGIPGIVQGPHDFRMVNVRGTLVQAFVRTPAPGQVLPNVAQGGSTTEVAIADVPDAAMAVFHLVDSRLQHFHDRIYSIDVGLNSDGRWMLFELNSRPALFGRHRGPSFVRFHEALADLLLTASA